MFTIIISVSYTHLDVYKRQELSRYLRRHRNVVCTPDQIVVGAGVQSLLHILCPMVHERSHVLMNNESFHQGRTVFEDHGFSVSGIEGEKTELPAGSIFYLTPSQITSWGGVMGIGERDVYKRQVEQRVNRCR